MKRKSGIMLAALIALFLTCGCASTIQVQTINPQFNAIGYKRIIKPALITVEKFNVKSDELKNNIIGEAKTGAFNARTPIVSEESVPSVIKRNLEKGLKGVGFRISTPQSAEYFVEGEIEKFWVDEHATGFSMEHSKAYVKYDVIIKTSDGTIIWAKTLEDFTTSGQSMDATMNNLDTLQQSLLGTIASMLRDDSFWEAFSSKL